MTDHEKYLEMLRQWKLGLKRGAKKLFDEGYNAGYAAGVKVGKIQGHADCLMEQAFRAAKGSADGP